MSEENENNSNPIKNIIIGKYIQDVEKYLNENYLDSEDDFEECCDENSLISEEIKELLSNNYNQIIIYNKYNSYIEEFLPFKYLDNISLSNKKLIKLIVKKKMFSL
jgi:hypothetical protein